jgi:heme/copper-type cytochrome/quinol oxidase subunit 1
VLVAVGLALAVQHPSGGHPARRLALAALFVLTTRALVTLTIDMSEGLRDLLGVLAHGTALVALLANARRTEIPAGPAADYLRGFILVYAASFVARAYMASLSVGVHLADTYFMVGDFHMTTLLVLALAGPMALRHVRPERFEAAPPWRRRLGPLTIGAAILIFGLAELGLGHAGMPRRYYAYLPEFTTGHRLATVAALLLCLGLVSEAALWTRGRAR